MIFIISILLVGVLFLVPSAVCTWLWGLILVPMFDIEPIGFWSMYGLIWMVQLMTGSLFEDIALSNSYLNNEMFDNIKFDSEDEDK